MITEFVNRYRSWTPVTVCQSEVRSYNYEKFVYQFNAVRARYTSSNDAGQKEEEYR